MTAQRLTNKIIFEIQPSRYKDKYVRELVIVKKITGKIHIPDAPLGYPKAHVLSLASIAINRGFDVTIHLRVIDLNENALVNTLYGAYMIGVKRILFLRGDPPTYGKPCESVSPEKAIEIARKDTRLDSIEKGLIISLRYSFDKILKRLRDAKPDFILTMNNDLEKLERLRKYYEGTIISYTVIRTPKNSAYLEKNSWTRDIVDLDNIEKWLKTLFLYVDEVLLTAPRSVETAVKKLNTQLL